MKAAVFREFGGPEVLRIDDVETPEAGPGQVRIAVRAAALNHLDLWARRGMPDIPLPHIGGSDIAGVIDRAGEGVEREIGEPVVVDPGLSCGTCEHCLRGEKPLCARYRIIGEHTDGGFAEFIVVPEANAYGIPERYPFAVSAAAPLPYLTAWRGLVSRAKLAAGESVLITGASGGVAVAAIRIARHIGATVHAITTTANLERVESLGADSVWDRSDAGHRKSLFEATGRRGVDVVFDSVGRATWHDNIRALARGGRMVVYGATTGHAAETDVRHVFWKQISILGTTMSNRREFEKVMNLVFDGTLEPVVDVVWPLERIREAHERLERGEQFGKVVLEP
jgi:NADPH:quinone reductase-like Zn-dependent oxidoreductase